MGIKQTVAASTLAALTFATPGWAQYNSEQRSVTLVGCVMQESEYRRHHARGPGGPLQSGLNRGNDFVLVDAIEIAPGASLPAGTDLSCSNSLGGKPYETKGKAERTLKPYVGQRIQLEGIQTRARVRTDPASEPTGGNTAGPQNFDLEVFEVVVGQISQPTIAMAAQTVTTTTTETVVTETEPAMPAPVATAGIEPRRELPKTASPLPFAGLLGLLSMAAALGLRLSRRS